MAVLKIWTTGCRRQKAAFTKASKPLPYMALVANKGEDTPFLIMVDCQLFRTHENCQKEETCYVYSKTQDE